MKRKNERKHRKDRIDRLFNILKKYIPKCRGSKINLAHGLYKANILTLEIQTLSLLLIFKRQRLIINLTKT
jgi:hypothetical protein